MISIDNCATRLRLEVKNMDAVNQQKIKETGVVGVHVTGAESIQVIIGPNVQFVADEMKKLRRK